MNAQIEIPWLPHRHLSVVATLAEADELIDDIGRLVFAYLSQPGGTFDLDEEPSVFGGSRTVVSRVAPVPKKIALRVHDALVTLRGALEHTLYVETEYLHGGSLEEKTAKQVQMPAFETREEFERSLGSKNKNRPHSLALGGELSMRIEPLQPFHWPDDASLHPLARLTSYTNHFKHREPARIAMRIAGMYRDDYRPQSLQDLPKRADKPAFVGEVLAHTPYGQRIPVTMFPAMSVNRPNTENWPILINEVDEIATWVRIEAIPRLITGERSPGQSIPARYDINVGHVDERAAIAAGTMATANQASKQRHGAASVRLDFVELLSSFLHAPDTAGITAWADQLSDSEVLEKFGRVQATDGYEPSVVYENMQVLSDLADEAAEFVRNQNAEV